MNNHCLEGDIFLNSDIYLKKKKMNMHNENSKICKFNLFKKCKYGENCKFRHVNIDDINRMVVELQYLKAENDSLKEEIQKKSKMITNSKSNNSDVSSNEVHACEERL